MVERRLIPDEDDPSSSPPPPSVASSNVVGVVPRPVHDALSRAPTHHPGDGWCPGSGPPTPSPRGRLDSSSSGLSWLVTPSDPSSAVVWEHSASTPSEDITPPSGPCAVLVHPEHDAGNGGRLLVACAPPPSPSRGAASGGTVRDVYLLSGSTGVLCAYVLDASHANRGRAQGQRGEPRGPDSSVRIALRDGEVMTSLVPASGPAGTSWLLASTSRGRLVKVYKTSRPLALHAKFVPRREARGGTDGGEQEEAVGLARGIYEYLTTPSKRSRGRPATPSSDEDQAGHGEDIAAILPVPTGIQTPSGRSPPPKKMARTAPGENSAGCVTVGSDLTVRRWTVSLSTGPDGEENEGYESAGRVFPMQDGRVDLSSVSPDLAGYDTVELVAEPALAGRGDGEDAAPVVLMAVRVSKSGEGSRLYLLRVDGNTSALLGSTWLSRFSSESAGRDGGTVVCVGVTGGGDRKAAYAAFAPRGGSGEPVTVCAVPLAKDGGDNAGGCSLREVELFSDVVPGAVRGTLGPDGLDGGCVLLSTSGLIAGTSVRFRSSAPADGGRDAAGGTEDGAADEEEVRAVRSHLLSSFRQYARRVGEGAAPASAARSVVPPSLGACPPSVLSAAASAASAELAGGGGSRHPSPSASSPSLGTRLAAHVDLVNYLRHSGAWRRVTPAGRIALADHAETMAAAGALLSEVRDAFAASASGADGDPAASAELARLRREVAPALGDAELCPLELPSSLARLQGVLSDNPDSAAALDLFIAVTSGLRRCLGAAFLCRHEDRVHDVPACRWPELAPVPRWTESEGMLDVLTDQLRLIGRFGGAALSAEDEAVEEEDDGEGGLRRQVEDIVAAALAGRRDAAARRPDDPAAASRYDDARRAGVPLLRGPGGDDSAALASAVEHCHLGGVVEICRDHRSEWRDRGRYSSVGPNGEYDLRVMMSGTGDGSPYSHLHRSIDLRTGLAFNPFVLRWHADRGLYPEVFELGRRCPNDLTRYIRGDARLSDLSWVQDLRTGGHETATAKLLAVDVPLLGEGDTPASLWERDQMRSLAKLSNRLARSRAGGDAARSAAADARAVLIEDDLTLISAQRMLQRGTETGTEVALGAESLLSLAREKIQSASSDDDGGDARERTKAYAVSGLAVSSVLLRGEEAGGDGGASPSGRDAAASIWAECVLSDLDAWRSASSDSSDDPAGRLSEEELVRRVGATSFVDAAIEFDENLRGDGRGGDGGRLAELSFLSVKDRVWRFLGSDDLADVLVAAATIVADSN